jgi:hypothetical protein
MLTLDEADAWIESMNVKIITQNGQGVFFNQAKCLAALAPVARYRSRQEQ